MVAHAARRRTWSDGRVATRGGEAEHQRVGEPAAQPLHGLPRAHRVGQRDLQPVVLDRRVPRVGEQVVEVAGQGGQTARHRRLDELGGGDTVGVELHQPRPLGVGRLGERVGQGRPAVADTVGQHVAAVQVAQGRVGDVLERRDGDARDATDTDVALGLRWLGAGDEGVGDHDRPHARPTREVASYAAHRLAERGLVGARGQPPRGEQCRRVEPRQWVERHRSVLVLEQHRGAHPGQVRAHVDPRTVEQPRPEPEATGRVVVAARHDDAGAGGGEPGEGLVGQPDRVDLGQRPVVDVARHDHDVDALGLHDLDQVVHERRLVAEESFPVEGPAQVPVGGVEDAHTTNLGVTTDKATDPRRRGRIRRTSRSGPPR